MCVPVGAKQRFLHCIINFFFLAVSPVHKPMSEDDL